MLLPQTKKSGLGKPAERPFTSERRSNICERIRAEIVGVTFVLSGLAEGYGHPGCSTHRSIIFRIKWEDSHGIERFYRAATRNPCHFFTKPVWVLHHKVIGHHQATIGHGDGVYLPIGISLKLMSLPLSPEASFQPVPNMVQGDPNPIVLSGIPEEFRDMKEEWRFVV